MAYRLARSTAFPGGRQSRLISSFCARSLVIGGIVGPKTLAALFPPATGSAAQSLPAPPWVTLSHHKIGLNEKANNKTLRDWLKSNGHILDDPAVLPQYGDFMETRIARPRPAKPMVDNPYYALNWMKFGIPIDIIRLGAVVPFKRDSDGHIAIREGDCLPAGMICCCPCGCGATGARAGCTTTKLENIQKNLPAICSAAEQAHNVSIGGGKMSGKDRRPFDAVFADSCARTAPPVVTTAFLAYVTISSVTH